jgi:hypothetical protein
MKWVTGVLFALAIIVKYAWHSNISLSFPVSATMSRGFSLNSIVFWLLIMAGISTLWGAIFTRKR